MPDSIEQNELRMARSASETRLKRLRAPAQHGGFNAGDDHLSVIDEKKKLAGIVAELDRLTEIDNARSEKWRAAGAVTNAVEAWLRTETDGHSLVEVTDPPISEIIRKGERIADAIARLQRRCRELGAYKHRISSAPFPSSVGKQRAREQIDAMAASAEPYVAGCVEFLDNIRWPEKQ